MTRNRHLVPSSRRQQAGLSLVELMVGMVIGLLLVGGMIALFTGNKQTYRLNEELARLQENSRFAIEVIERSLRMAGHIGCPELNASTGELQRESIVPGLDLKTIPPLRMDTTAAPVGMVPVTPDVITVTYGSGASARLASAANEGASSMVIQNNALGFTQGEVVLISTCEKAELFRISNVPAAGNNVTLEHLAAGGNSKDELNFGYGEDARVMRLNQQTFLIASSTQRPNHQPPVNSLFVGTTELVEGVDDMVVTYGIPTAAGGKDVTQYVAAGAVTDWNDVLAVKVELLLASVDDFAVPAPQTVFFNGQQRAMADRRMYTTASTTVSVRGSVD